MSTRVSLIEGIFGTIEVLALDKKDIHAMKGILNAELADSILDFIHDIEEPTQEVKSLGVYTELLHKANLLKEELYDICYRLTFPKRVREKDLINFIAHLDMKLAIDIIKEANNLDEIKGNLNWLFENKMYWTTMTEKRSKDSFLEFKEACSRIQSRARSLYDRVKFTFPKDDIAEPLNVMEILKYNKECFYSPNERPQKTGLGILNERSLANITLFLKGVDYFNLCKNQSINKDRRVFVV